MDDALLYLEYLKDTGQTAEAQEYELYLRETGQLKDGPSTPGNSPGQQPNRRLVAQASSTRVGRERSNGHDPLTMGEAFAPLLTGLGASASQVIPGMEAAQAGVRSVARRQPYSEALSDMRGATDQIPTSVKLAVQAPAMMATGRVPINPAIAGAAFGGLSQALSADDISVSERAGRTAVGAGMGWGGGKILADVLAPLTRAHMQRQSPGELVAAMTERLKRSSKRKFRAAKREGNAAPPQIPNVRAVLDQPDIKPFADQIRGSRKFANASDATVLREVHKLMGKQQRGLNQRMQRDGFDAQFALQADDIGIAKGELLNAADAIMPSFRRAVRSHARGKSEIEAVGTGVDAARRVIGAPASGKRIATQSEEAFAERLRNMTPRQRRAAVQGALGHLQHRTGFQPNAVSVGGLLTSIKRPAQMANFLRSAGDEGQRFTDYLARIGLSGAASGGR